MSLTLLVAGAAAVDAGKTTFALGLRERTGATAFKPRAASDYWADHGAYRRSVDEGRLYGADAARLAAANGADPERINPVHRLWLPTPGRGRGLLGRTDRAAAVDRVRPPGDGARDRFLVNGTIELPDGLARALPLEGATRVTDLEAFNRAMARLHEPATAALSGRVRDADPAVVESYADVARVLDDPAPDAVAVVEPRRCRVYDGARYARARTVASGSARDGRLETRTADVVELLDPAATVGLPALPGDRRGEPGAVADAYAPAYRALLAAADG